MPPLSFEGNDFGEAVFVSLEGTRATIDGKKIERIEFQKGRIKIIPKSNNDPVMIFKKIP